MTARAQTCQDPSRVTELGHAGRGKSLILSIFPGIDLLGRGFELEGFCIVRGPDILWGQDVRDFRPVRHVFAGVIGGSPCQDFSKINRRGPTGYGDEKHRSRFCTRPHSLAFRLKRCTLYPSTSMFGTPVTFSKRNHSGSASVTHLANSESIFQFGSRDGKPLVIARCVPSSGLSRCCLATEAAKENRRTFADFCELQGLPRSFELPGWSRKAKYRAVGNGVPIPMGRVIAIAVKRRPATKWARLCICDCGREVPAGKTMATDACRKRMQRKRDAAAVTEPGPVTPAMSLF